MQSQTSSKCFVSSNIKLKINIFCNSYEFFCVVVVFAGKYEWQLPNRNDSLGAFVPKICNISVKI